MFSDYEEEGMVTDLYSGGIWLRRLPNGRKQRTLTWFISIHNPIALHLAEPNTIFLFRVFGKWTWSLLMKWPFGVRIRGLWRNMRPLGEVVTLSQIVILTRYCQLLFGCSQAPRGWHLLLAATNDNGFVLLAPSIGMRTKVKEDVEEGWWCRKR